MKKLFIIILIVPSLVGARLRVIQKNRMIPITCAYMDYEDVMWNADTCFMNSTYTIELTTEKLYEAKHKCLLWAFERYKCKNYLIVY